MKLYNFEQWTQERFDIRKLKLTAGNATAIWNCGKWLDTYILSLVSEYFSSWEKEKYTNNHMDRGNELEPIARDIYELENWVKIEQVWFVEYNEYVWCSPDWLIWEDGWIEIKSQDDNKHFKLIINWEKEIDSWYIWQIQMNLLITWRKWRDFVSYNPNYKKSLVVHRIYPDLKKFESLLKWFKIWEKKIKELINLYNNSL